jgi:signal recognition particle subunit SRP54
MFDDITEKFEGIFKRLRGQGKLSVENISEAMREVRRALLEADVNFKVAKKFIDDVQAKAIGDEVLKSITPGQQIVKIVYDELTSLMGATGELPLLHTNRLNVIVMAGLQGSGKTTAAAKLALYFRKHGHRPMLIACDIYRPAAVDQLETLGKGLSIPVYSNRGKDAVTICKEGLEKAHYEDCSLAIVDTAGRLHVDAEMMAELKNICTIAKPDEILYVADAMTGQDAVNAALEFHKEISFTGCILSKMDGDARGGAALSIRSVTGVPVRFIGTSEKPDGLELFHPDRMASRILGMGDIVTLVEKAQGEVDEKQSRELERKLRKNAFSLQDFLDQLRQIKKMGSIGDLLAMIPGMGSQMKDVAVDEKALVRIEAMICSMTAKERDKPLIIDGNRKRRIASGSGTTVQDINKLLKQFDSMKVMMKRMNKLGGRRGQGAALKNVMPF